MPLSPLPRRTASVVRGGLVGLLTVVACSRTVTDAEAASGAAELHRVSDAISDCAVEVRLMFRGTKFESKAERAAHDSLEHAQTLGMMAMLAEEAAHSHRPLTSQQADALKRAISDGERNRTKICEVRDRGRNAR